jgi:hypothetical protein
MRLGSKDREKKKEEEGKKLRRAIRDRRRNPHSRIKNQEEESQASQLPNTRMVTEWLMTRMVA